MKKLYKYLKRALWSLVLLIVSYLLISLALSFISTNPENVICADYKTIFIATNGIHLDIIIPRDILPKKMVEELKISKNVNFVSFGWGDKAFYLKTPTWDDLKLHTTLRALFFRSESAIHLTNYHKIFEHWNEIRICEIQLKSLVNYLDQSFKRDGENKFIEIKDSGYTVNDTFYEANGNFNCFHTCNDWVNRGLKAAKVKTSIWSPFDKGILYHVKKKN